MARLWTSGFELNSDTGGVEWTARHAVQTFSTSVVRSGVYSHQISSLGSGTAKGLRYSFQGSANNGPFFFRVYVRFTTFPGAENGIIQLNDTAALTTPIAEITIDNGGVMRLWDEDSQITGTTTLSTGIWYRVEFEIDVTGSAGSHVLKARVDGTQFASDTARSLSAGVMSLAVGGNLSLEANTTGTWYFDDIAINDNTGSFQNSYPGEGEVILLRPSAAGDNADWTRGGSDSGANWSQCDEVTPNDVTDYVSSGTLNQVDDYNLEATPAAIDTSDVINCVQVGFRFTVSSGSGSDPGFVARIKAAASGTVEEGSAITTGSTSYASNGVTSMNYQLTLYDLPGGSTTPWTKADLDTAQIGIRVSTGDTDSVRVSTMWLLVDHKPGSGGATDLVVQDATHENTADAIALTVTAQVAIGDATHENAADAIVLTVSAYVAVTEASHEHVSDTVALTANFPLAIADATHEHVSDTVAIAVDAQLSVDDATHVNVADSITLTTVSDTVVQDATHEHVSDAIGITVVSQLSVDDAAHAHAADSITLTTVSQVVVQDATHEHVSDVVTVTTDGSITLTVQDAMHVHAADSITLTTVSQVVVPDATHEHVSDAIGITVVSQLSVDDAAHAHAADSITLTTVSQMVVQDATHEHVADMVTVTTDGSITLTLQNATHVHAVDGIALTAVFYITVTDAVHVHVAENVTIGDQIRGLVIHARNRADEPLANWDQPLEGLALKRRNRKPLGF